MFHTEAVQAIMFGRKRKPRQPAEPRGRCDNCGKIGLGNTYTAKPLDAAPFNYRQCKFCDEIVRT